MSFMVLWQPVWLKKWTGWSALPMQVRPGRCAARKSEPAWASPPKRKWKIFWQGKRGSFSQLTKSLIDQQNAADRQLIIYIFKLSHIED
jgi:hypothetical protein